MVSKKPDLQIPTHSHDMFDWHDRRGAVDASTMGVQPGRHPGSRVWNDSVDVGFIVRNSKTGNEMLFLHVGSQADKHGELSYDEFSSYPNNGITIKVYND